MVDGHVFNRLMKKEIIKFIKSISQILSRRRKIQSYLLILFSLVNGFLESLSIVMVLIYGNIILFPKKIDKYTNIFSDYFDESAYTY